VTATPSAARAAIEAGDPRGALSLLDSLDPSEEVLALRADAAYRAGAFEAVLAAREALYSLQIDDGRTSDAALTAATIAMHLLVDTGLMAAVRAWVARADRLLDTDADTDTDGNADGNADGSAAAAALVAAVRTYERLLSGDADAAGHHARRAITLGASSGVELAVVIGRIGAARLLTMDGRIAEGMAVLDEVAVELMAGDHDAFLIGNMYCELVCAAQAVLLVDRAREWTDVMERWRHGVAFGAVHGRCRVHRAELLRISGPASAAEEEALGACADLRPWMRREFGWPLVELGNIRLRRGDLVGAEDAFRRAHECAWSPQPGLALLRMEQGALDAAAELIAAEIDSPMQLPWKERPPIADLQLVPLLEAQAEIAFAARDTAVAAAAADRLRSITDRHATPGVRAGADLASARAAVLAGDPPTAVAAAGAALATWVDLDAPYDAATARVVLGHACVLAGRREAATLEWESARAAFAAYGAPRRQADVEALLGRALPAAAASAAALARDPSGWRIGFAGREVVMVDLKGIRLLGRLLSSPGKEHHVLDLAGAGTVEPGMPALDDEAKAAYRRRLAEVEDDIAEAERHHDLARAALARRDREYLMAELRRAVGLHGRTRRAGGTVERARTSVTRTLRYAIGRITDELPELGEHLSRSVRTGAFCSYAPDPLTPVTWRLDL